MYALQNWRINMTVEELINLLQTAPPNAHVFINEIEPLECMDVRYDLDDRRNPVGVFLL
jgi:hypothetical protein